MSTSPAVAVAVGYPAGKSPETQRDFTDVNRFVFAETSAA
jgi:hypothetical protein